MVLWFVLCGIGNLRQQSFACFPQSHILCLKAICASKVRCSKMVTIIQTSRTKSADQKALDFARKLGEKSEEDWRSSWQDAADFGLFRRFMPEKFGGAACTAQAFSDEMMAIGHGCPDNGLTMGINSHVWTVQQPLVRFGSDEQISKYLPALLSGKSIGSFALTEQSAGSDALNLSSTAVKKGQGYELNGAKTLIGMAPVCDVALVFASTAPERGSWGISAFILEAGDEGFTRGEPQSKIGLKTLPMGPMQFEKCFVPEERRLGPEGAGAQIFQATLDWERAFLLAPHVGAMARQLDQCAQYCKEREVFGQPIDNFQSVSNRLADMRVRLETCKLLLSKAAAMFDAGEHLTQFAAMTNLHISEAFLQSSIDAFRNFGGVGYLDNSAIGRDVMDSLGGVIYSGTSDVLRGVISRMESQKHR